MLTDTAVVAHGLALLGLPGVNSVVQGVFNTLGKWIAAGAASLVVQLVHALESSTSSPLGAGFSLELPTMVKLASTLAAPFLVLATIQAIINQDSAMLLRTVMIRLPIALVMSGVAVEIVSIGLNVTDSMSAELLRTAGGPAKEFLDNFATVLGTPGGGGPGLTGFAGVLVALLAAVLAFVVWLELVVREAAVSVATLFLPLVLAAVIWPITAHWVRRLAETIAALVLTKLVIAAVLALAAATVATETGVGAVVEGIALFVLAGAAPFSLLRLIPFAEQGAAAHLEGLSRRAMHTASSMPGAASTLLGSGDALPTSGDPIEMHPGSSVGGEDFDRIVAETREEFFGGERSHTDSGQSAQIHPDPPLRTDQQADQTRERDDE